MISIEIERPAASDPVTLAEAKRWLRLDNTDEDDDILALISAATQVCETFTMRSFVSKGFKMTLDSFPYFMDTIMSQLAYPPSYYSAPRLSTTLWNYSQQIKVLRPPLISVDRITYLASADAQYHDMTPAPPLWYPGTLYATNQTVVDNNLHIQKCIVPGTSGALPPEPWNDTGGITVETYPDPQGEASNPPVQWQDTGLLDPSLRGNGEVNQQFGKYVVDTHCEPGRIFPGSPGSLWPNVLFLPNAVQIHFTAGYGDASKVPAGLKVAIKMLVANWYENREAAAAGHFGEIPSHIQTLLWAFKVMDFSPTRG
jgi:Phage gp6-like head-tail connector protein